MATVKIFLASSAELQDDRREFEIAIARRNAQWQPRGVFLQPVLWEDMPDALAEHGLQQQYNDSIRACDLFVLLYWTKVGRYTALEFEAALDQFLATGRQPRIFVYSKQAPHGPVDAAERASREAFEQRLAALKHYKTDYPGADFLKLHFIGQLDKLVADGLIVLDRDAPAGPPFEAPPPDADHVPRDAELAALQRHFLDAAGALRPATVGMHGFGGGGKTTLARLLCADPEMRAACRDGMLWIPLGRNPIDARQQMAERVLALTGSDKGCTTLPGARARLQAALKDRRVLVVIEDIWNEAHAADFLQASAGCARLITTRNTTTLPPGCELVDVAAMTLGESAQVLAAGLPGAPDERLAALARRLGQMPLLLRLANRALIQRVVFQKTPMRSAIDAVEQELARKGVLAFDPARHVEQREQAVAATIESSLELLDGDERRRCAELALFAQDVPIPLAEAAVLWRLTGALDADGSADLVQQRLDPLSLVDFDGAQSTIRLHEVFRGYLATTLADRAALHDRLAAAWTDRPPARHPYAWRWLAYQRAQAIFAAAPAARHEAACRLVALVADPLWQQRHEALLADLPALREALALALDAAAAAESPDAALLIEAADTLLAFDREHASPAPIFALAAAGELEAAKRRSALFLVSLAPHWRQALLLLVAWLAPPDQADAARALCAEVQAGLGPEPALHDLLAWVQSALSGAPVPPFVFLPPAPQSEALIEQLLQRAGGGEFDGELIAAHGLDASASNPDAPPPTRGIHHGAPSDGDPDTSTTRYLADIDGPSLAAYAAADLDRGSAAIERYLSVYTNYSYAEYRYSTLWLLLGHLLRLPRPDGGGWVRDTARKILVAALGGASVEFEESLAVAAQALRAKAGDAAAHGVLQADADRLCVEAALLKPGRRHDGSDVWAHHKRRMLAHAQALGWLLGDRARADRLLQEAAALADSGYAAYQAMACLALAETVHLVHEDDPADAAAIGEALQWAQNAAHNVQDASFCARVTARVNTLRQHWLPGFDVEQRAWRLGDGVPRAEFAALHRVGHAYPGRRPDALRWAPEMIDDRSFDALQRLYQRPKADFLRWNGADHRLLPGEEVAVPDPGLAPHLAARVAAEALAQAGGAPPAADRLALLRALVPKAAMSRTALDAVLARLVLAQARRDVPPSLAEAEAIEAALARRPAAAPAAAAGELIANRLPS